MSTDAPLYSVRQLADELGLPESTVRYYRDSYGSYLPVIGTGPRRLYPAETLERLRMIRQGYQNGLSRTAIEEQLAEGPTSVPLTGNGETAVTRYEDLVATILDGERERREAILNAMADRVGVPQRALPEGSSYEHSHEDVPHAEASPIDPAVEIELATLRAQLDHERELVERLRRSKVEMERRAAEAEELLRDRPADGRPKLLRRFLQRDPGG